jgi:hypothetical protein
VRAAALAWSLLGACAHAPPKGPPPSELEALEAAAVELVARVDASRDERVAELAGRLASARSFVAAPPASAASRRAHARVATALAELHYFEGLAGGPDEHAGLAESALAALREPTGDSLANAWTALAMRSARDGGLPADRRLERAHVAWTGGVELDAPARDLAAALAIRAVAIDELDDPASLELRDELLRRAPEVLADPEATWLASIGFYQLGGTPWERWNRLLKEHIVERLRPPDLEPPIELETSLRVLAMQVYYRYSASVGAR